MFSTDKGALSRSVDRVNATLVFNLLGGSLEGVNTSNDDQLPMLFAKAVGEQKFVL